MGHMEGRTWNGSGFSVCGVGEGVSVYVAEHLRSPQAHS